MASSLTKDSAGTAPGSAKTFFGHPRGLATLFMTEMWERFSFYGMRALLVYYLISGGVDGNKEGIHSGGLAMTMATATAIYGVYLAMVYLLAMPGGWFGDRVWGPRKTVTIASIVIIAGHFTLALPGQAFFFVGMALVAAGSGLLKANISTMVGQLYDGPDDPRRDGGFTVFYMSINIGAFVAPLIIGTVGETVSWHLGFALAGFGMALGLIQFLLGTKHLNPRSSQVPNPLSPAERTSVLLRSLVTAIVVAVVYGGVVAAGLFTMNWALVPLALIGLVIPIAVLARIKRDKDLTTTEQSKMSGYIWFFAVAAIFWMIFDQAGSTLSVFGKGSTSGAVFGLEFPATWFQSLNPLFVMALAPVFAWLWLWLARKNQEPSTTVKFGMALWFIGVSFFIFVVPMLMAGDDTKVSPLWLVSIYLAQTIGELCLSPVGLSVTTKLAPAKYASQMMGVWFLAVTAGDSVMSLLSIGGVDLNTWPVVATEAAVACAAGLGIFTYRKKIIGLMGNVH